MSAGNVTDRPVTRPRLNVQSVGRALKLIAGVARVLMIIAPLGALLVFVARDGLIYLQFLSEASGVPGEMAVVGLLMLWTFLWTILTAAEAYFFFGFVRFFAVYFGTVIEKRYL